MIDVARGSQTLLISEWKYLGIAAGAISVRRTNIEKDKGRGERKGKAHLLHYRSTCDHNIADSGSESRKQDLLHAFLDLVYRNITDSFQDLSVVIVVYSFDDAIDEVKLPSCKHCSLPILNVEVSLIHRVDERRRGLGVSIFPVKVNINANRI
jgi:hypothetical protein